MKFTFLGTGTSQGVPVIGCHCQVCTSKSPYDKRLRTSLLVESKQTTLVVDAGPDLRQQLLRAGIEDIDALLITHEHMDHTAGLDEVRAINFIKQKSMAVYCTGRVEKRLREQYSYIFNNPDYPGIPKIYFKRIPENEFKIGDIPVKPIQLMHASLPVLGFRFNDFTYITDANVITEAEKKKAFGSKVLVLNALRKEKHHSHFHLAEALRLSDELNAQKACFTHISHQMGLHKAIEKELPQNRHLAFDGLEISL